MNMPRTTISLLLLTSLLQAQSIRWETDFDAAMKRAKDEKRVVFVAINMEGERANDEAVDVHYRDSKIASLASHTVNLFATADTKGAHRERVPGLGYADANAIEIRVREKFLGIGPDQDVVAPQHLFVDGDGKVLLSVPYRITVGELEWMFVQAIKKVDPEFDYKPSDRMRAPRRLALGYELPTEPVAKAPSKEEIEEIIKDLKRGRGSWRDNWKKLPLIMLSDEKDAINFVKVTMSSRWISNNRRVQMLEGIGKSSPSDYYVVVEDYLEHEEADVREAAAVAMARLAEPKASRSLRKAMSKEEDVRLEGLQLRALASCAPKERSTSSLVEKAFGDKDEVLRMHAVVASGLIENRKVTEKVLTKALGDPAAKVRSTAAYVIGTRRITELIQALVLSSEAEADAEVKGYMTAAKELCEDKESKAFAGFLETVVGDKKSVYKPDEDWPFGPGPRNGGGDDEDPGKKKKKG